MRERERERERERDYFAQSGGFDRDASARQQPHVCRTGDRLTKIKKKKANVDVTKMFVAFKCVVLYFVLFDRARKRLARNDQAH
jgi:hypothetical protein